MTDREQFDNAMSQCGYGCDLPKKKVRWFEIVTGYVVGVGFLVAVSLVATHFIG